MDSHELPQQTRPIPRVAKTAREASKAVPRDGDLLVARDAASGRYTLRQLPAAVQISASSRDEALQVARRFAQVHAVNVWYQDKDAFRLLEAYRVERSLPPTGSREEGRS